MPIAICALSVPALRDRAAAYLSMTASVLAWPLGFAIVAAAANTVFQVPFNGSAIRRRHGCVHAGAGFARAGRRHHHDLRIASRAPDDVLHRPLWGDPHRPDHERRPECSDAGQLSPADERSGQTSRVSGRPARRVSSTSSRAASSPSVSSRLPVSSCSLPRPWGRF